jgi:peptidyl-prolyl cis-trans isomerase D
MLEQMRKQSQSAIILLLFGIIIIVFIFSFGAGSVGFREAGCGRTGMAAIVNDESISDLDFNFLFQRELQFAIQQKQKSGQKFRMEDKLRIRNQVMDSLIQQALLIQAAQKAGLYITDKERNENIRKSAQFQDDENKMFSFKLYKMLVKRYYRTTLPEFEEYWRKQMLSGLMAGLIQETARVTDDELLDAFSQQETKVDISFVSIPTYVFTKDAKASDEEIDKFVENNADRIKEFYDSHQSRYHKPKKVKVAHVFFEVRKEYDTEQVKDKEEQAGFTVDDLKKGAKFEEQVKSYSEDEATREKDGQLAMSSKEALAAKWGTPFAEAAFKLAKDEHSKVVKSDKGYHVIKCLEIIEAEDRTLEESKRSIASELLTQENADKLAKLKAEELFENIKKGKKLEELLPTPKAEEGKTPQPSMLTTLTPKRTGLFSRTGNYVPQLGMSSEEMIEAIFSLKKENPIPEKVYTQASPIGPDTYVVFYLEERQDPDMAVFEKTKKEVRDSLLSTRRNQQLSSWLDYQMKVSSIEKNPAFLTEPKRTGIQRNNPAPF